METRKRILYLIFLALLWLPLIQMRGHLFQEAPLQGAFLVHEQPEFNAKNWFDGSFQSKFMPFINDTLGFHKSLIRARNTFYFKVLHQSGTKSIIIGKKDWLYETSYIESLYGKDYLGSKEIQEIVGKIKKLQDDLDKEGKSLVICLAPSKADYHPEYIPKRHRQSCTDSTNYKQFSRLLKSSGINLIDFNAWFLEMKSSTPYPLYPKYGIHWSQYGMLLATDSLVRYIEQLRGSPLVKLEVWQPEMYDTARSSDNDIGKTLNLFPGTLKPFSLCYPYWHWLPDSTRKKPRIIAIADSYFWQIFNTGIIGDCFSGQFWYYNETVYPESYEHLTLTKELNKQKCIQNSDIVLFLITSNNLKNFGWGFMDDIGSVKK